MITQPHRRRSTVDPNNKLFVEQTNGQRPLGGRREPQLLHASRRHTIYKFHVSKAFQFKCASWVPCTAENVPYPDGRAEIAGPALALDAVALIRLAGLPDPPQQPRQTHIQLARNQRRKRPNLLVGRAEPLLQRQHDVLPQVRPRCNKPPRDR